MQLAVAPAGHRDQARPRGRLVAEGADRKPAGIQGGRAQLTGCGGGGVAGQQAQGSGLPDAQQLEKADDAGQHLAGLGGQLVVELPQVAFEKAVVIAVPNVELVVRPSHLDKDERVDLPGGVDAVEGEGRAEERLTGCQHGPAPGPLGCEQGAVDVEQQQDLSAASTHRHPSRPAATIRLSNGWGR